MKGHTCFDSCGKARGRGIQGDMTLIGFADDNKAKQAALSLSLPLPGKAFQFNAIQRLHGAPEPNPGLE